MSLTPKTITIDCPNPRELAAWWAAALGAEIARDHGDFVLLAAEPLAMGFQQVPEGKEAKNRVHVDFESADREAEVERLVGLGAKVVAEHSVPGLSWVILQDPAGNEFCVAG